MFAPPPEIETRVFARMPDEFRRPGTRTPWAEVMARGPVDSFLEGPSFDRDGNLYVVDIPYGRVFRISPDAEWSLVAEYDGEPNGLKFHADGRAFIADHSRGIMALDVATGAVTTVIDRPRHERFKGCNDLFFAADGTLYFTDQGQTGRHDPTGRLWRLAGLPSPKRAASAEAAASAAEAGSSGFAQAGDRLDCLLDMVPSPNGLVGLDERMLYLAVTRDNAVWRVPLLADGTPTKVGVFVQLSGGIGPDGLALDEAGNLAIAHAGLGTVWLVTRLGEPLLRIKSSTGLMTTNLAYGPPDRQTLYITESETATVLTAQMPVPGRKMYG